jgi:sulfoxide reductase heme-binding subunit YedZ
MENEIKKNRRYHRLRLIVEIGGALPFIWLLATTLNGDLGFNPIETITRRTGNLGMFFLILSLSCTPINKIFNLPSVGRLRKPLGLYAAFYAFLHFVVFIAWDYNLNLSLIWNEIANKPFLIIGLIAFVILMILAATSFRSLQRKMGKTWVWLHRLVYIAGILVVIHYLYSIKGDIINFEGDYGLPLVALVVVSLLLLVRIEAFYRFLRHWFVRED